MAVKSRVKSLIDPVRLPVAGALPEGLEGLRILQISDVHIRRARARHEQLLEEVGAAEFDVLALSGDIMHRPGHEETAMEFMGRLMEAARPRYGSVGCFGNHDSARFKEMVGDLPVKWLCDACYDHPELPIRFMGLDGEDCGNSGDMVAMLLGCTGNSGGGRLRILLSHEPSWLPAAADVGVDLVLSGHTHGGQVRLPGNIIMYNAQRYWPLAYTTGILRSGGTMMVVSRGLGESYVDGLRLMCAPHAPLITLAPGSGGARREGIEVVRRW